MLRHHLPERSPLSSTTHRKVSTQDNTAKMQGFNMGRYRPPEDDHPPAKRPRSTAPPTVRFEMPFPIWCSSCPKPTIIGQGVRFNAQKRRAGNYYSTPIWRFTIKHADCGGEIDIETDPKNTAYVVTRGARKRETGEEEVKEGDTLVASAEEREALRQNAFAGLEKTIEDRERAAGAVDRLADLEGASARFWDDPYTKNQALRKTFRKERKRLEKEESAAEDLKGRLGLGIDLLPETGADALRASLVDFGTTDGEGHNKALARPMFAQSNGKPKSTPSNGAKGKLKSEILASKRKESLVSEIIGNTRVAQDPFLEGRRVTEPKMGARFAGVKGKQDTGSGPPPEKKTGTAGLVNYDSE